MFVSVLYLKCAHYFDLVICLNIVFSHIYLGLFVPYLTKFYHQNIFLIYFLFFNLNSFLSSSGSSVLTVCFNGIFCKNTCLSYKINMTKTFIPSLVVCSLCCSEIVTEKDCFDSRILAFIWHCDTFDFRGKYKIGAKIGPPLYSD